MWLIPPYNFPGGTYMAKVWTMSITKYGTWPREYNQIWHLAQRVCSYPQLYSYSAPTLYTYMLPHTRGWGHTGIPPRLSET